MSSGERERLVVIGQVASKVLRQGLAAERLGLCVRQMKRLVRAYRERGDAGLVSRQRGLASNRRLDAGGTARLKSFLLDPPLAANSLPDPAKPAHHLPQAKGTFLLCIQERALPLRRVTGATVSTPSAACNARLREAVYRWARVAMQVDPESRRRYAALRQRGKSRGREPRTLADRLLAVACAMLKDQTLYDKTASLAAA